VVEDLVHLALADARLSARERARLEDVADLLDLSADDVAGVVSEYADPDFADHRFAAGDEVEVKFDDEWSPGVVVEVESSGDLRVRFANIGQVYWINPTADLVRPRVGAVQAKMQAAAS
jgi:hypothetical protein